MHTQLEAGLNRHESKPYIPPIRELLFENEHVERFYYPETRAIHQFNKIKPDQKVLVFRRI